MKRLIYIISALALCVAACKNEAPVLPISTDITSIDAFNEGGEFNLQLSSGSAWTVSTDVPWITVTPANGPSSTVCTIKVDSTVLNEPRASIVRFFNNRTGSSCDVNVYQEGYGYNITLAKDEVSIKNYANIEDREFHVTVHTNVPFDVEIAESASKWLSYELPSFNFDRGARPRDIKVKFKWGVNAVPMVRETMVKFVPKDGYSVERSDVLRVSQAAAPEIIPGHDGDSTVIMSLSRSLGQLNLLVTAEPMANWDIVKMWEDTDEGYTPEKKGRVRGLSLTMFSTTEEVPYEIQYLTELEELVLFSNVNSFRYNLSVGEYLCKLTNLKRLMIAAYGLSTLPAEFAQLSKLEYLDISSNNFSNVPAVLTPENFPNLKHLFLNTCQRHYILDLSNSLERDLAGLKGEFPRRLLEWENLETLRLSVNFIEGEMPDMLDYPVKYTAQDCVDLNLPPALVGTPKVLPNATYFAFNLNRMYGKLPDWVLYHPNLTSWEPYVLCYPQEGRASNGTAAVFSNVPVNMDYYWSFYDGYKEHEDIYIGD